MAYSRYILDVGQSEDWLALQMALAPCLIGYGAIARRLHNDSNSVREGNDYWKWIENYVADDYIQAVKKGSGKYRPCRWRVEESDKPPELLEKHISLESPGRIEQLVNIFIRATQLEIEFWDFEAHVIEQDGL